MTTPKRRKRSGDRRVRTKSRGTNRLRRAFRAKAGVGVDDVNADNWFKSRTTRDHDWAWRERGEHGPVKRIDPTTGTVIETLKVDS